jgi:hypothetical protein
MNADEFIAREEQKVIENLWSARNAVTVDDMDFLADLKVEYGDCCGMESNCPPEIRIERGCIYCGKPADSLGYCENMRRFMECEPKSIPGNSCVYGCGETSCHYTLYVCDNKRKFGACFPQTAEDVRWTDRAFLNSCGIAVDDAPRVARGVVYIEIEMKGESVRKARKRHALRKRKPLMGEHRATGCGHYKLGEFAI